MSLVKPLLLLIALIVTLFGMTGCRNDPPPQQQRHINTPNQGRQSSVYGMNYFLNFPAPEQNQADKSLVEAGLASLKRAIAAHSAPPPAAPKAFHIVIDAGHDRSNIGARSYRNLLQEETLTYTVAQRVKQLLAQQAPTITVTLTRTNPNQVLSLSQRVALINRLKPDYAMSIHFNASANRSAHGVETYTLPLPNAPSSVDTICGYKPPLAGHAHLMRSTQMAFILHHTFLQSTLFADRGIRHAHFKLLRDCQVPMVLFECNFISNPAITTLYQEDSQIQLSAQSIANAITSFGVIH